MEDVAGNSATAVTDSALLDATAPSGHSVSFDDSTINNSERSSQSFTFTGGEVGADYSYTISSSGGGTNVTGSGTLTSATDTITGLNLSGLGDGTLTLSVVVTDVGGSAAGTVTYTAALDTLSPAAPSTPDLATISDNGVSTNDNRTSDTTPTFTGIAEVGSTVILTSSIDGQVGSSSTDGSGNWSITSSLSYTTYSMTATAMDGAGNQSSDSGALSLLINHDPAFAGTPTITGTPEVGETMGIAVLGTSDADTGDVVTLSYQWQRDSSNIPGAILSTYMLTATESNTTITCEISARDLNGGEKTFTTDGVKVGGDFPWLIFMPALSSPNKGQ